MTTDVKPYANPKPLTSRQRAFVVNLVSGMSQSDAYINAGYSVDPKIGTASDCASRLMAYNVSVQAYYQQLLKRKEDISLAKITETIMSAHEVKVALSELARADLSDFLDDDGTPRLSKEIPHHSAAKKYYRKKRVDRFGNPIETHEIQLHDKVEALKELAKIHGLYAPQKHMVAKKVIVEMIDKRRGEDAD